MDYCPIDYAVQETYAQSLKEKLLQLEKKHRTEGNRIFYLAIPPTLYENVISNLGATGLIAGRRGLHPCSHRKTLRTGPRFSQKAQP